jgi:DNA-binding NtrC family response regulator
MTASVSYKDYPVLFVDDEEMALITFQRLFKNDFTIYTAQDGERALEVLEAHPDIALVATDQRMPRVSGLELLIQIAEKYPAIMNILITAYSDMALIIKAVNQGNLYRYIAKPYEEQLLKASIMDGLNRYHTLNERALFFAKYKEALRV